jgi:chromate transporter
MLDRREASSSGDRVPLSDLFIGFLKVSLCGFGGGLVWARRVVVEQRQWMGEQEFAETLTLCQLMPGAATSALATFEPPCLMYYLSYRLWDRFRDMPWQRIVRRGLAPLTIGLVIAGGYVMARSAAVGWQSVAITVSAVALMLGARLNPLWILMAGGVLGGLGLL